MVNTDYNWTYVQGSSNIAAISFTAEDPLADYGTLRIRFASGAEYSYDKVPNQLAAEFFESESKGQFFHANIRKYDAIKAEADPEDISEVAKLQQQSDPDALAEDLPAELPETQAEWDNEGGQTPDLLKSFETDGPDGSVRVTTINPPRNTLTLPIPHRPNY